MDGPSTPAQPTEEELFEDQDISIGEKNIQAGENLFGHFISHRCCQHFGWKPSSGLNGGCMVLTVTK